tara:strand:- start:395 stop:517 length:123 start_codon:yes stop_codon:yes gene_type:complete
MDSTEQPMGRSKEIELNSKSWDRLEISIAVDKVLRDIKPE